MVLVTTLAFGVECDDDKTDVIWLVNKLLNIGIFNDTLGVMNRSLLQEFDYW